MKSIIAAGALIVLLPLYRAPAQVSARRILHGHVPAAVAGLTPIGSLPGSTRLKLAIGLPLHNSAALDRLLHEVYDPSSPNFRHYLTPEQFARTFGPTDEEYRTLLEFAATHGLAAVGNASNRMVLNVSGSAADVEKAFHLNLRVYRHPTEKRNFYAPESEPSVDAAVPAVDICGLDNYALPHPNFSLVVQTNAPLVVANGGSQPNGYYWGKDFRNAYVPGTSLTGSGQVVGLLEFDGYYGSDITNYENQSGLPNVALQNVLLDGASGTPGYSGIAGAVTEVSLDIEMAVAMAPGLSKVLVFEGELENTVLSSMAANGSVKQFSSSWTWGGGPSTTTDNILKQLAAQGQSYFQASGDSDAYGSTLDQSSSVTAPADSTNVTSVGATTLTMNGSGASWASETVWNAGGGIGSSGGSSTYYLIPTWQQGISMTSNLGSTTRRNIPDVAMVGNQIWVIHDRGQTSAVGGTSCAAPLWAGFTALVNQLAAANGKQSVGLINSAAYAIGKGAGYASAFHDITTGNNFRSGSSSKYPAVAGYDLCTGWGTPNGANLITALASPVSDSLVASPGSGFASSGPFGGPFAPVSQSFTLTNSSASPIAWALLGGAFWLDVSQTSGILPGDSQTNITASLSSSAVNLAAGTYSGNLIVTNISSGVIQTLPFSLTVAPIELVLNGGFEAGSFSGWSLTGGGSPTNYVTVANRYFSPHSGYYVALLGQPGLPLASLSQTLTTVPGQPYLLSFWLNSPDGVVPNELRVSWNGNALWDGIDLSAFGGTGWSNMQFVVAATGSSSTLRFDFRDDTSYLGLDDVSVEPIPAPFFNSISSTPGALSFSWIGMTGMHYQVQYSTNLSLPDWLNLGGSIPGTNSIMSVSDPTGPDPLRFYRVSVSP